MPLRSKPDALFDPDKIGDDGRRVATAESQTSGWVFFRVVFEFLLPTLDPSSPHLDALNVVIRSYLPKKNSALDTIGLPYRFFFLINPTSTILFACPSFKLASLRVCARRLLSRPLRLPGYTFHTTSNLPQSIEMGDITHSTIKDGWFREISNMWPGQAMTLKVEKVLHHEKSKYQDVLIFKSTDYGNVLVLDNVIQATERDEFAYQEMITNLAMMSHPSPKKVLVIGGGDGGVLREVVKHECVEEAILCDIDEAVIRLSKQYLPHMSAGFDHPKVKVHVGDGFKFLDDYKNTFDVIITDSSDPEGPAESLFQKPYFQLLHDALREGGVITTQAENQWLHLPLITKLKQDCKEIFPVAEYAYTTIPTYPSGQIGFMVCTKDANRNVKVPLRSWSKEEEEKLCRYYNSEIHKASFVLPTFAAKALQ
ncbi:Spermine/spermidine synthase-domain-containing protein [Apiosordaria backusii]|uniref:Spermine/spermidine synthase-domain-containing protein n=1 Tax=Apiosordaria backusii TaxID=314023 RepID=A0AA40BT95_9PEZI|nr:Spermine/spermidine synthase-domain-containing protein [Apiosordaria backusii]